LLGFIHYLTFLTLHFFSGSDFLTTRFL